MEICLQSFIFNNQNFLVLIALMSYRLFHIVYCYNHLLLFYHFLGFPLIIPRQTLALFFKMLKVRLCLFITKDNKHRNMDRISNYSVTKLMNFSKCTVWIMKISSVDSIVFKCSSIYFHSISYSFLVLIYRLYPYQSFPSVNCLIWLQNFAS